MRIASTRRNIELKARNRNPGRALEVCERLKATPAGTLVQCDTYFHVPDGRLKLREEEGGGSHLVSYSRSDEGEERESRYRIVPVSDVGELKAALTDNLGVQVVVAKERRLFLWQSTRIHLDEVETLGSFIEFEAVAPPNSDLSTERQRVRELRTKFELDDSDLIGGSYCNLMLAHQAPGGAEEVEFSR